MTAPIVDFSDETPTSVTGTVNPHDSKVSPHHGDRYDTLKMRMGDSGTVEIKGQRYLKLGMIDLCDPIKGTNISNARYLGVLDTLTGKVLCLDMDVLYNDYILPNNNVLSLRDYSFRLSKEIRDIVVNAISEREKVRHLDVRYV
jgi:hypothetical protein